MPAHRCASKCLLDGEPCQSVNKGPCGALMVMHRDVCVHAVGLHFKASPTLQTRARPNTQRSHAGGLQFVKGDAFDVPGHGGPTVIELWASWCGPCRVMFPHLSKIAAQYADRGLRVVGISLEPDSPKLRSFVQSQVRCSASFLA